MSLCISEHVREEQPGEVVTSDESDNKDPEKGVLESTTAHSGEENSAENAKLLEANEGLTVTKDCLSSQQ